MTATKPYIIWLILWELLWDKNGECHWQPKEINKNEELGA